MESKAISLSNVMEELSFLKKQNFQIMEELEELKSFRKTKVLFGKEVLARKDNKKEWLSEKESNLFYEEMKNKVQNEI